MTSIDQPPCSSRTVDAFLRMGMAGFSWGLFMGSYDAGKQGLAGLSKAAFVARSIGSNSLRWGLCGGLYVSLNCGFEVWRMKRDWKNATLAGALTGAAVSTKKAGILKTALGASFLCSLLELMRPPEYPSDITK